MIVWIMAVSGLYKVEPNQSAVLSLFGKYVGTVRTPGLAVEQSILSLRKKYPCGCAILKAAS